MIRTSLSCNMISNSSFRFCLLVLASTLLLLAYLSPHVLAKRIKYKNCGSGDITYVDVSPCEKEPCNLMRTGNTTFSIIGTMRANSQKTYFEIAIEYGGLLVPLPGLDVEGCNYISCPVRQNKQLRFTYPVSAVHYFPPTESKMIWKLLDDDKKVLGCIETEVVIANY